MTPKLPAVLDRSFTRIFTAALACISAHAAQLTWDITPGTVGAGDSAITGGTGTWDLLNGNWTADGGVNNIAWTDGDSAIFGGTAGIVTLGAAITADDLTFSVAGFEIAGGTLSLAGTPTVTTAADATISATIAGTSGLTKLGAGILTLTGANTFTGNTVVDNGTLVLGNTGGPAILGNVQMGNGTAGNQPNLRMSANNQFGAGVEMSFVNPIGSFPRFDLQGTTQTLAGINNTTGAGVIQNEKLGGGGTTAAATLQLNGSGTYSYNGYMRDRDGGAGTWLLNIVKAGTGTQTLSGGNITYTGTTTVNDGTLEFVNTPVRAGASTINGGTLRFDTTTAIHAAAVTINAGGTLNLRTANTAVDANRFTGAIIGNGTIVKDGAGWYHTQGTTMANFAGTIQVLQGRYGNAFNNSVWTNSTADAFVAAGAELDLRTDDMILDQLTGSGSVINTFTVGEINTLTVGIANGSSQFDGVIRGTLTGANNTSIDAGRNALLKAGNGTFTVTGANIYVGPTTVNGGVLQVGAGGTTGQLGTGNVTVNAAGTLAFNRSDAVTFGTLLGGAGALTQAGTGTLTISNAASNLTGAVNVNSGTLVLQGTRLINGAKNVAAGATLEINSEVPFLTRWNNGGTISGSGTINKTGSGVFGTIGAVNFSGTINVLAGRLHNDNVTGNWTGSTADVNVSAGAVLDLRANDIFVDELNGLGEIWNSHPAGGGDTLFVGVANGSSTFGGTILGNQSQAADNPNGAVLSITKQGTGTFTITGGSNVYSGATTVNNGILRISGGDNRLSSVTNLTVNGGATFGGTFDMNGLNQTVGALSGAAGAVPGTIIGGGTLTVNGATSTNFGGNLTGAMALTKAGNSTLMLSGASTHSGPTLISLGALGHGSATAFSPNSNLQLNGGVIEAGFGTLALNTGTGGGAVQWLTHGGFAASGAPRDITLNGGADLTWSVNNFVGDGLKLVLGSVAGNNTASITNNINLGGANRTVEVVGGAAVIEGALAGTISNGTLTVRGTTGSLALTGQATADVVVDNSNTGSTNQMNLVLNRVGGNAIAGGLQIGATDNNQFATVRLGASDQIADTTVVSFGAVAGSWSYLNLNGFNETIAGLSSLPGKDGGVIQLVEGDASPTTNSTLTLNVASGTQSYTGHTRDRGNGATNDPGGNGRLGFTKEGAGTQELLTWNTQVWTGPTAVNNGTLRIGLGAFTGGGGTLSSATTIASGATLDLTNAPNNNGWTHNGTIAGAGNVVKSGNGVVNLSGAGATYTGTTTVNSGTLRLTDATAFASNVTVNAGAFLEENRTTGSGNLAITMSGAGGYIKQGAGETILPSPVSIAQVVVRGGVLTAGADNVLTAASALSQGGSSSQTFKLNGTSQTVGGLSAAYDLNNRVVGGSATASSLTVNIGAGQQTFYGGKIGDSGADENNLAITKTGPGTLVLGGTASHTGGTVIAGGTLQLGASTTMPVNLANLGIWLDGADPEADGSAPADGTPIAVWKNKGTLGVTGDFAAQVGREPSYGATGAGLMNNNPTVRFTATPSVGFAAQADYDKLVNPINLTSGPSTIIVAGRYAGASADERKRLVSAMGNNYLLGWWNNGENTAYYQNGFAPGTSAATTNAHVYTSVMRGDGVGETYANGLGRIGALGNAVGPNGLALGGGANYATQNTENSTGDIGELIIAPGTMSDADRAAIEAYLVRKWTGFIPTNPLPTTGALTLSTSGATLDVNGVTQTVASISGVAGTTIALGNGSLTVGDATNTVFAGAITGTGAFTKVGSGTLELSGTSDPAGGPVLVQGGTLLVTGSISGSLIEVQGAGTIGGNGTIGSDLYITGTGKLSPGTSPGTLTVTGTTLDFSDAVNATATGALVFELGTVSDRVNLTIGQFGIGTGVLEFDDFAFTAGSGFGPGTYTLFDSTQDVFGSLGTSLSGTIAGFNATIALADTNNDIILNVVPEPGSAALLLGGLAMLAGRRRRAK